MRGMARFVCLNWTDEKELLALSIAFGATDEVSRRFDLLGGSPRSVIAEDLDIALIQETDVPDIALILVVPYFCLKNYRSTHHTFFQYFSYEVIEYTSNENSKEGFKTLFYCIILNFFLFRNLFNAITFLFRETQSSK
jgi:hypothetical protein